MHPVDILMKAYEEGERKQSKLVQLLIDSGETLTSAATLVHFFSVNREDIL